MKIDYNTISKTYDNHRSYGHSEILQLIRFGEIEAGAKILDLGCGTGNLSTQLLEFIPADVIGIDKSLQVLCGDADHSSLPIKDNSFDLVIGAFVIHHMKNTRALIRECYRILNDGALILITSSHRQIEKLHPVLKEFFPSLVVLDKKRFPEVTELDDFFKSAGFKSIKHKELVINRIPIDTTYLDKIKSKYVTTLHLLSENEFRAGVEKLEAYIKNNTEPVYREWRGTMIYGRKHDSSHNHLGERSQGF